MPREAKRAGAVNGMSLMLLGSVAAVAGLTILLTGFGSGDDGPNEIHFYCAAGMREPMKDIARQYKEELGVSIRLTYGGSGDLLSQIELHEKGDLFLAGDDSYIKQAIAKNLATESLPIAFMKPVIAVPKGNPKNIKSIDDLLQPDIRVSIGNPGAAAVGRKTRKLLTASGHWEKLNEHVQDNGVFKPTVNEIATDIKVGSVDAGIIWDSTTALMDLEAVEVPELDKGTASIEVCVLNSSKYPSAALKFARYVAARDKGLQIFQRKHFKTINDGDKWAEKPTLTFFAGAVNQHALEPIIEEFKQREGVDIAVKFAGCGDLTGQMRLLEEDKGKGFPDVFMACDVYYLRQVQDLFETGINVSDTDIVIVVQKGNPKNIQSLDDLKNDGVRVAIGRPRQCTIGVLSKKLLEKEGLYDKIRPNIVTEVPSSAQLIPQIVTKAADAVLAYRSDTRAEQSRLEVITINSDIAKAIQPFSVAQSTQFKYLSRRLFDHIARSRDKFERAGFNWRLDGTSMPDNDGT